MLYRNLDSDGDDDGNNCGKEANSNENKNSTISPDKVATKDAIKCDKKRNLFSNEEVIKDSLPQLSVEHEKDASKRKSGKKKIAKKQKKSKNSEGEENNHTDPKEVAIPSVISSEKEPTIPASTKKTAKKRRRKPTVTFAEETATAEDSTQDGIHTKKAPDTRRSTEKKIRKKNSTGASTVETIGRLAHDVRSKDGASNKRTSTKKKKRNRKKVIDLQAQEKENNIQTAILKRLLVEMLKLPLQVLAILIRILDRLENCIRTFLDSI